MTILTADRHEVVNASEAAALFGLHPWFTGGALDLYMLKAFDTEPQKPHKRMDVGHLLEPWLLDQLEEHVGPITRPTEDEPLRRLFGASTAETLIPQFCLGATLDGLAGTTEAPIVCQAKTHAMYGPGKLDEWGEDWTDQIPHHVTIQVNTEMICCGAREAYVVVFIGQHGVRFYRIQRSDALCEQIVERAQRLMASVKARHFEPTDWPACGPSSVTALIRREPKSSTPIEVKPLTELATFADFAKAGGDLLGQYDPIEVYQILGALESRAKVLRKGVQSIILSELGNAEIGLLDDGRSVSYKQKRGARSVDFDLMQATYPEAYEACVSQPTHREMRIHKAKKSKGSK